ncbi:MAG: NAD(P)H-dependent oxidoreductase subunit E [Acidobacteriota bacterium]
MSAKFEFDPENLERFQEILGRYPKKRAAMLPTLHLAHHQLGLISPEVEQYVAQLLEVPLVDVHEVLTFYTLFFRRPMGRHHIRLCMSISCWIRGAGQIKDSLARTMGVPSGEITPDGNFSWEAVPDCLGACEMAPMMQLDKDYHGNLTPNELEHILTDVSGNDSSPDPETLRNAQPQRDTSTTDQPNE